MKNAFILIISILLCLALSACGKRANNGSPASPSVSSLASEASPAPSSPSASSPSSTSPAPPSPVASDPEIDDQIDSKVVSVIWDHVKAVQTKDEDLVKSTVLPTIPVSESERTYQLWNTGDTQVYDISKMSLQSADDKTEVVNVLFKNGDTYSFALIVTKEGWKIYDID